MEAIKRLFRGWSWEHWYNLAREDLDAAIGGVRHTAKVLAGIAVAIWLVSGTHVIRQNEVGLKSVCGHLLRGTETPGLRFRLPWPLGAVRRVPLQTQQRVTVGVPAFPTDVAGDDKLALLKGFSDNKKPVLGDGLVLLSADHNVLLVQAVVQYIIVDPKRYVYGSENAELAVKRAATNSLLACAAVTSVDDLLTTARVEVQKQTQELTQQQVDAMDLGLRVVGVELQQVSPPEPVAEFFRGVNGAREERNTTVNQANQYAGEKVPEAQGEADRLVKEAEAFRESRLAAAHGEASQFNALASEFKSNGVTTAERLRDETVEATMAKAKKVQVAGGVDVRITAPNPADAASGAGTSSATPEKK
jgi:membrane protease subunit HflK